MRRLLTSIGLVAALLVGGATAATADPRTESLAPEPIAATTFNGSVHALAYARGMFFVGGEFDRAIADGDRHTRTYLATVAPDGELRTFSPELNGPVYALTADTHYLYAAGRFTEANGHPARHLARFSLRTGEVDRDFDVTISALPRALELADDRLYIGGDFNSVNGESRGKFAAVDTDSGELVDFAPTFDRGVRSIEAADGRLYVGGGFTTVDDVKARKIVALDRETAAIDTGFTPKEKGLVYDIDAYDGRVYTAAGGPGGRVLAYEPDGDTAWERITDGDVTAVSVRDGVVVAGGHFDRLCAGESVARNGACLDGVYAERGKMFAVDTSNNVSGWNPAANSVAGTFALTHGGGALAAGGAFTTFADGEIDRRGLALFPY